MHVVGWQGGLQVCKKTCTLYPHASCGFQGIMPSWFSCWFWCCVHYILVCLASPLTSFFFMHFSLLIYFLTYLYLGEYARSISRPEVVRVDQTWTFKLFQFILSYSIFFCSWRMVILHCSKFSYFPLAKVYCIFCCFSPGFDFVFSVLVKRLAGKSLSKMTYFVSSGM